MRTLKFLLILPVSFSIVWVVQLSAQESSCDVPLVVTRFVAAKGTSELVTDLATKDLTVKIGDSSGTVNSMSVDSGSKRVALILDASKKVPNDEWKLETEMAISLIENARALDRFVLLFVGVDTPFSSFLPLGDIQVQLRKAASSRPEATDASERIYDTLLAAAKRLDPPEFGDAIFLFGHPDDTGSEATPDQVEELVLRNRLRFYAMSFTDPLQGKLPPGFDLNRPLPANAIPGGADNISHATGYFFSYHSVRALSIPGQLTLLEKFLGDLYVGIATPYRLRISPKQSSKTALDLAVVNSKGRGIYQDNVHYPHFIYPCTSR